ncbi:MAG: phosphotransferase [Ponticaulis sp.]|nr:phosphotransferase [Ponticaulis sp.]
MSEWINRQALLANTGGDRELAAEVLEIFRTQVETWGRMLDPKDEPARWADAAHTLKGAALGIGASRLAEVCKIAETTGRSDPPPSLTMAAVRINDIRDCLLPTMDEAGQLQHEFAQFSEFRAS